MDTFQKHPLKIYIQDIYRAKRNETNKYIYELFGLTFKNIMIHGVITSIYNKLGSSVNFELTDATGSVQIYYNYSKTTLLDEDSLKNIEREWRKVFICNSEEGTTLKKLFTSISNKCKSPLDFNEGDCVSVVGDLFLDELKETRMVSAFQCKLSTCEREIIWLEELQYLYDKFYLWKHV